VEKYNIETIKKHLKNGISKVIMGHKENDTGIRVPGVSIAPDEEEL
jgi:hypothetical protein